MLNEQRPMIAEFAQMEEKMKAQHEIMQRKNTERHFNELVARVLSVLHIDNNHSYGMIGVSEDPRTTEFKDKVQATCKEYL